VRHKDRQLENWMNAEERDKQALERISKENKDLRTQIQRHKFDMNDLAKKLKWYLDETARLKLDNEKLAKENDQLVGHKNPS
jgi:regulator of replication initiation timing